MLGVLCDRCNGLREAQSYGLINLLHDASTGVVRVWGIGRPEKPLGVAERKGDVERLVQASTVVGLSVPEQ